MEIGQSFMLEESSEVSIHTAVLIVVCSTLEGTWSRRLCGNTPFQSFNEEQFHSTDVSFSCVTHVAHGSQRELKAFVLEIRKASHSFGRQAA